MHVASSSDLQEALHIASVFSSGMWIVLGRGFSNYECFHGDKVNPSRDAHRLVQASTSTFYPFTLEVDSNINALTVTAQISAQLQIRAPLRISAPPKAQNL